VVGPPSNSCGPQYSPAPCHDTRPGCAEHNTNDAAAAPIGSAVCTITCPHLTDVNRRLYCHPVHMPAKPPVQQLSDSFTPFVDRPEKPTPKDHPFPTGLTDSYSGPDPANPGCTIITSQRRLCSFHTPADPADH
jgi:hypothetical protein